MIVDRIEFVLKVNVCFGNSYSFWCLHWFVQTMIDIYDCTNRNRVTVHRHVIYLQLLCRFSDICLVSWWVAIFALRNSISLMSNYQIMQWWATRRTFYGRNSRRFQIVLRQKRCFSWPGMEQSWTLNSRPSLAVKWSLLLFIYSGTLQTPKCKFSAMSRQLSNMLLSKCSCSQLSLQSLRLSPTFSLMGTCANAFDSVPGQNYECQVVRVKASENIDPWYHWIIICVWFSKSKN